MGAYLYMLRCADGSYYVGTTRTSLEHRVAEHQAGSFDGYTARRRPVVLVFHQQFDLIEDAIAAERQVKGWRREKKAALIRGDFAALPELSRRAARPAGRASRRATGSADGAPRHEEVSLAASSGVSHPEEPPSGDVSKDGRPSRRTHSADRA